MISRQKVGAIGAEKNFAPTPLLKNKVQQYQGFRGRGSRGIPKGRDIYIHNLYHTPLGWEGKKKKAKVKLGDFK